LRDGDGVCDWERSLEDALDAGEDFVEGDDAGNYLRD
jgi:hypothetical protein